eukprot:gene27406-34118_t
MFHAVGLCSPDCNGKVRAEHLSQHAVADATLTALLVDEILTARAVQQNNGDTTTPRKRSRENDDAAASASAVNGEDKPANKEIYIDCLAHGTTESTLKSVFSQYGQTTRVFRPIFADKGNFKGFAFVTMNTPEEAQFAVERSNGILVDGAKIRVSFNAVPRKQAKVNNVALVEKPQVEVAPVQKVGLKAAKGEKASGPDNTPKDMRFAHLDNTSSGRDVKMEVSSGERDHTLTSSSAGEGLNYAHGQSALSKGLSAARTPAVAVQPVVAQQTSSFQQMLSAQYTRQ